MGLKTMDQEIFDLLNLGWVWRFDGILVEIIDNSATS
jgi:hypothetical protein